MFQNAIYSVISPEGCASILWRNTEFSQEAAKTLKLTSADCKKFKIIDDIKERLSNFEGKISKNDRNSIFQALEANTQKPIAPDFEEASKDQIQNAIVSASKAMPVFAHSTPQKRANLLTKI